MGRGTHPAKPGGKIKSGVRREPIPTELITQLAQFILEQNPETILSVYLAHPAGRAQA